MTEYTFQINPEKEEDWNFLYEIIEDDLEIEYDEWNNKYHEHDKIFIEISDKSVIKDLLSYELPPPKYDDRDNGVYFSNRYTVKSVDGNSAVVQLEFVEQYGDYKNLDEIMYEVTV